jgi:hypothetical protein
MIKKIISFLVLVNIILLNNVSFAEEKNDPYKTYENNIKNNCLN